MAQQLSLNLRAVATSLRANTAQERAKRYQQAMRLLADAEASREAAERARSLGNRDDAADCEADARREEADANNILSELSGLEQADLEAVRRVVNEALAKQEEYAGYAHANGDRGPRAQKEYLERQREITELRKLAQRIGSR